MRESAGATPACSEARTPTIARERMRWPSQRMGLTFRPWRRSRAKRGWQTIAAIAPGYGGELRGRRDDGTRRCRARPRSRPPLALARGAGRRGPGGAALPAAEGARRPTTPGLHDALPRAQATWGHARAALAGVPPGPSRV